MQIHSHCMPIISWRRTAKVLAVIWLHGCTNLKGELNCIILDRPDGLKLRLRDLYHKIEDNYRPTNAMQYISCTNFVIEG